MSELQTDIACARCGCVCDDLRLTVENGRIVRAEGACHLAHDWFLDQDSRQSPEAEIEGQPAALDAAVRRAAEILASARAPLIYGLSRGSTGGHRAAVRLADRLGATIDTPASREGAASTVAFQQVGMSTCTLGEIRSRADLMIYWGVDPVQSHPRHIERFVDAAGPLGRGRDNRALVVLDSRPTATSHLASRWIAVPEGNELEAVWALRTMVRGRMPDADAAGTLPLDALHWLAQRMKSCGSGVVFFGPGLSRGRLGHLTVEGLLRLVAELNDFTRFYARPMQTSGDATGAGNVLCWQTGYPCSVNLARGYPRYSPGEYSAGELLDRREVDACLLVGSESTAAMSAEAQAELQRIPTISLDEPLVRSSPRPTVRMTTAVYGVHVPGMAYRMDEVPIPLRAVLPARYPSDEQTLDAIYNALP